MIQMLLDLSVKLAVSGFFPIASIRRMIEKKANKFIDIDKKSDAIQQLLIDISVFHINDGGTGIQRVVRSILYELSLKKFDGIKIRYVGANRKKDYIYVDNLEGSSSEIIKIGPGDVFLGLDLAAHIMPFRMKQLTRWKSSGVLFHFMIYDILPLTHAHFFTDAAGRRFKSWSRAIAILGNSFLCVSKTVKSEVDHWLDEKLKLTPNELPTRVVPLGCNFSEATLNGVLQENVKDMLRALNDRTWVLMVGTLEPRKGHTFVLDAFENLWLHEQSPALVFIGQKGWFTEAIQKRIKEHPKINQDIFWFDTATDSDLSACYQNATGVIAASLAEGYGLPLAEAIFHQTPLLARDIPVFRETAGKYAKFFDSHTALEFSNLIQKWTLDMHAVRRTEINKNLVTWATATNLLLKAIDIKTEHHIKSVVPR